VNAAPRTVGKGIRLVRPEAVSSREIALVYSLISLRVSEIEAELWERKIRPMIAHNGRRAESEESRDLLEDEVTFNNSSPMEIES
jgi:hypothetical protein